MEGVDFDLGNLDSMILSVSTFFDNGMKNIDGTLTAWYGSVLDDIGDTEHIRAGHT